MDQKVPRLQGFFVWRRKSRRIYYKMTNDPAPEQELLNKVQRSGESILDPRKKAKIDQN